MRLLSSRELSGTLCSLLENTETRGLAGDLDLTVSKNEQLQGGCGWCMKMERSHDEVNVAGMNVGYVRAVGFDVTANVAAQKMGIQRFVEERGGVVVDWYVDEHISGRNMDGPALQRMLADAESGHGGFPRVFVWSFDRLSPKPKDIWTIHDRLTAAGVMLFSVKQAPRSGTAG